MLASKKSLPIQRSKETTPEEDQGVGLIDKYVKTPKDTERRQAWEKSRKLCMNKTETKR